MPYIHGLFSLIGAIGVIIGLYVVLWGKSKDLLESNEETKLQIDEAGKVRISIDESSGKTIDLEEPLLPDKSSVSIRK